MITILGVGHVFDLGASISAVIEQVRPGVVAVELDPPRYRALAAGAARPGPGVYGLLGLAQRHLARKYGVRAGGEMLAAVDAARAVRARVAFIDMDSGDIVRRMVSEMGGGERLRFFLSAVAALFVRRKTVDQEVAHYEANPTAFLEELGRGYPSVKRLLLDERNAHMARELRDLEASSGEVVAVVGEGHVDGLAAALADRPLRVLRLPALQGMAGSSAPVSSGGAGDRSAPPPAHE